MVSATALNSQVLLACFQNACGTPIDNLWCKVKRKHRLRVEVGVVGSGIPQQPQAMSFTILYAGLCGKVSYKNVFVLKRIANIISL